MREILHTAEDSRLCFDDLEGIIGEKRVVVVIGSNHKNEFLQIGLSYGYAGLKKILTQDCEFHMSGLRLLMAGAITFPSSFISLKFSHAETSDRMYRYVSAVTKSWYCCHGRKNGRSQSARSEKSTKIIAAVSTKCAADIVQKKVNSFSVRTIVVRFLILPNRSHSVVIEWFFHPNCCDRSEY